MLLWSPALSCPLYFLIILKRFHWIFLVLFLWSSPNVMIPPFKVRVWWGTYMSDRPFWFLSWAVRVSLYIYDSVRQPSFLSSFPHSYIEPKSSLYLPILFPKLSLAYLLHDTSETFFCLNTLFIIQLKVWAVIHVLHCSHITIKLIVPIYLNHNYFRAAFKIIVLPWPWGLP